MKFNFLPLDTDASTVTDGLNDAKTQVMNFSKPSINNVAVPIGALIIVAFLLFFIIGVVDRHRGGGEYRDKIIGIIICLIALVLVLTFPAWGWKMIGQ